MQNKTIKLRNMAKILDGLKEFAKVIQTAVDHAEYECFKLKDDIVQLLKIANEKGFNNPVKSELTIKYVNRDQTIVVIDIYFNGTVERYKKFSSTLDLGSLVCMPISVKKRLDDDGQVKIALDTDDFNSLFVVSTKDIRKEDDYNKLTQVSIREEAAIPTQKILRIKDRVFFYEVEGIYVFSNGTRRSKKLYIGEIKNIPPQVVSKLLSDPDLEVSIDVTNM